MAGWTGDCGVIVARKTNTQAAIRIWSYGALPPRDPSDAARVRDILGRARRYYNVNIERFREERDDYVSIRRRYAPGLVEAEEHLRLADEWCREGAEAAREWRAAHFRRTGEKTRKLPLELSERVKLCRETRRELAAAAKALREPFAALLAPADAELARRIPGELRNGSPGEKGRARRAVIDAMLGEDWPEPWKELARRGVERTEQAHEQRAASGLAHGTYTLVEDAAAAARKAAMPALPRFRGHDGGGRFGVQIQGGVPWADVIAGHGTFLRLTPAEPKPGKRQDPRFWVAWIRVGTTDEREPDWIRVPVQLHRQPPEGSVVQRAWVHVRRVGQRLEWRFQVVLKGDELAAEKRPRGSGEVEVDYHSRTVPGGVRVASWADGELVLPERLVDKLELSRTLRGHRDEHYDTILEFLELGRLSKSARTRHGLRALILAWATDHIEASRAHDLWGCWLRERPGGDLFTTWHVTAPWCSEAGLTPTEARAFYALTWARKDQHLEQYNTDVRRRAERWRDAIFRREAIRLATQYHTLVDDDRDLSRAKELPDVLAEENAWQRLRTIRQNVAPGRCREIFREVFHGRHRERSGDGSDPVGSRDGGKDHGSESVGGTADAAE